MDIQKDEKLPESKYKRWSNTTKLIVGLSIVALLALLIVQLRSWIGPLILSVIIAYLFYPLASFLNKKVKMPWGLSVSLIYLLLVLLLLGLLTWGGFTFVQPITNLVNFIQQTLNSLPDFLNNLTKQTIVWGPIHFSFNQLNIDRITEQALGLIQPILSQTGSLLGSFASGAFELIYRVAFLLLISYFILFETKGQADKVTDIDVPGYQEDFRRLGIELSRIWNAFLRGQLVLMLLAVIAYSIILSILGVRFAIGLALLAGLARFVPYIGPWITWITYFLVALLEGSTIFGLSPFAYSIMVVGVALVFDTFLDNYVLPRVYANALRVHPAAVLIAILVSAAWLGLIGVVLAAPVLATIKLFWNYIWAKMLDRDPWRNIQPDLLRTQSFPIIGPIRRFILKTWFKVRKKT